MRRGMALLEIVVAVAILALMGTLAFMTVSSTLHARDYLEEQDVQNNQARIALSRIKRDLELAWLTTSTQAATSFRTLFVAHNDDPDRLWFATLSHQRLFRDARECEQTEITLWTEDDPTIDNALVLLRREAPRIDHEPELGGAPMPLAYGVRTFDVTFLDPTTNEWREEWDTQGADTPNRLPRAARVVLELLGPDADDPDKLVPRTYVTTVILRYADPLKKDALSGDGQAVQ